MKITVGGSSNEKLEFWFFLWLCLLTENQVFRQTEEAQNLSSETMLLVYPKEQSRQSKSLFCCYEEMPWPTQLL